MSKLKQVSPWEKDEDTRLRVRVYHLGNETEISAVGMTGEMLNEGRLLVLGPTGLTRVEGINPDLGFPLDEKGRIKLDEA